MKRLISPLDFEGFLPQLTLYLASLSHLQLEFKIDFIMAAIKPVFQTATARQLLNTPSSIRNLATQAKAAKKEGDISSVFVSLSGAAPAKLPSRFAEIKRQLIQGNEDRVLASWQRLLEQLSKENEIVAQKGPDVVPQIHFKDIGKPSTEFLKEVKKRGVAVVRGVVPVDEARGYKTEVEEYVRANPWTKGTIFPFPEFFAGIEQANANVAGIQLSPVMTLKFSNSTGLRPKSAHERTRISSHHSVSS